MQVNITSAAVDYLNAKLSVIPTDNITKQPLVKWKKFQSELPELTEVQKWFKDQSRSIAMICGKVSGSVELIDIDNHTNEANAIFQEWKELVQNTDPDLFNKLVVESTQSGGYHIIYRCNVIEGNLKLAKKHKPDNTLDTVIETRGEGGYALVAPSKGYLLIQGDITEIKEITEAEREIILSISRSFNEVEDDKIASPLPVSLPIVNSNERPGDEYNKYGDITSELKAAGWVLVSETSGKQLWRRPGKNKGISATFNYIPDKFYCFSSNSYPFNSERTYDKFSVYALLNNKGDFKQAAKDLVAKGFGKRANGNGKTNGPDLTNVFRGDHKDNSSRADQVHSDGSLFINEITLTDTGNSQRFFEMWKGKVKFNHTAGKWLIWDGRFWAQDNIGEIVEFAKQTVRGIKVESLNLNDAEKQNKLLKWAISSESASKLTAMIKLSESIPEIRIEESDLDTNPYYLNLNNGIYDLKTNQLLEHDSKFLISKIISIDYEPEATCFKWEDSLCTYFNNDLEQITFIQKICGLTLCGDHLEEVIFFLYGLGKNGKSVFIKVLEMVFSDYAQKAPVEMLLVQKNDGSIPNDVARLKGARFVVTSELPKGKRLNENRVKDLTGGDKITARFLHKEFFEFKPTHKLWIFGNHKPVIHGNDEGIWRRMILIPFLYTIPAEDRKPHSELMAHFEAEKPGILNWIIEGWKLYRKEGLRPPESILKATRDYQEEQDILADFVHECCDVSSIANRVLTKELHRIYTKWCEENNEVPMKSRSFNVIIEEKGFKKQDSGHGREKEFIGIAIKGGLF